MANQYQYVLSIDLSMRAIQQVPMQKISYPGLKTDQFEEFQHSFVSQFPRERIDRDFTCLAKRTGGSGGSSKAPKPNNPQQSPIDNSPVQSPSESHYYQFTMKDVKRAFEKAQEEMIVANLISRTQGPYTSH